MSTILEGIYRLSDGLRLYRYKNYKNMLDDIAEIPAREGYITSCLLDYSHFIQEYSVPVSLDSFIAQYWTIVPYFAINAMPINTKIYNFSFGKMTLVNFEQMRYDDNQEYDVIDVTTKDDYGNIDIHFTFPSLLYYDKKPYKQIMEKPIERMVNKQWKAHLITKTSRPLS